ncbi:DoxX family protein [Marinihelvus fidelis]|uniref:DoxX family protein n=1 Tax=Marinihelvus fidelis TaxID=2613842 RepID=A0A5N0TBP8_9GAMM|nr:DoxX family protein [Marinihelvus fidelis]KAA9132503.1 DoxX family protein [Marinihelvus fidelis]
MALFDLYDGLTARLRTAGEAVWPLALRAILFWEFWEAGITKYRGENWFADIPWADWQKGFPAPFEWLPVSLNWTLATWGEIVFSVMLLLGLFTRFAAVSLLVITAVATAAVHWPAEWDGLAGLWQGYVISADGAGNYKLPLLFTVMLLPLVFHGAGTLSLDRLLVALTHRTDRLDDRTADLQATGLALAVIGLVLVWVVPAWGGVALGLAALALIFPQFMGNPLRPNF